MVESVPPTLFDDHGSGPLQDEFLFKSAPPSPALSTSLGRLFAADCLNILPTLKPAIFDLVFADPPFNLGKMYGPGTNDRLDDDQYIDWCIEWINECVRVLKPGGSLFIYNLPKWNIILGAYLMRIEMDFRHAIAIDMKASLPIPKKLYPSHYSLLYFTKGKPATFRRIRTPIEKCRHCGGEIRDYGGHRPAMNPLGVNLKDVWTDIPPVRHWKFKSQRRPSNALSTKLLDRVIEIGTNRGDLVLDPFGGSGTTFAVCEKKRRRWVGIELDFADVIVDRLLNQNLDNHKNTDLVEEEIDATARARAYEQRKNTKSTRIRTISNS